DAVAREHVLALLSEPMGQDRERPADGAVGEPPSDQRLGPQGLGFAEADYGLVLEAQFVQRGQTFGIEHYAALLGLPMSRRRLQGGPLPCGVLRSAPSRCEAPLPPPVGQRAGAVRCRLRRRPQPRSQSPRWPWLSA